MAKFKMVERFAVKLPDMKHWPDHKLWTKDPKMTVSSEHRTFPGIDLKKHFGEDYRTNNSIHMLSLPEWDEILDLVFGFLDFDKAISEAERDRMERGERAKYTADEKFLMKVAERRETFARRCLANASIIQDVMRKAVVKVC